MSWFERSRYRDLVNRYEREIMAIYKDVLTRREGENPRLALEEIMTGIAKLKDGKPAEEITIIEAFEATMLESYRKATEAAADRHGAQILVREREPEETGDN